MTKPKISIVVAILGPNRVIGKKNELLVRISDDLKRFKALTLGHPVIMGRKTFESIGRPLPERTNIVVTRDPQFSAPRCIIVRSLEDAITTAGKLDNEVFVIGGADIYRQALPLTDRLYLSVIESEPEGDVFFPDYSEFKKVIKKEDRFDEKTGLKYSWVDLER